MTDDYEERYQAFRGRQKQLRLWTWLCILFSAFDLWIGHFIASMLHSVMAVGFAGYRVYILNRWRREQ